MRARYVDILLGAASNYTLAISDDWPRLCVTPGFPIVLARGVARWVGPDTGAGKALIENDRGRKTFGGEPNCTGRSLKSSLITQNRHW